MTSTNRQTYDLPEWAAMLGISRTHAYEQARTGQVAGVPVIRVGHRLLVPRAAADRVLAGEPVEAQA